MMTVLGYALVIASPVIMLCGLVWASALVIGDAQ